MSYSSLQGNREGSPKALFFKIMYLCVVGPIFQKQNFKSASNQDLKTIFPCFPGRGVPALLKSRK